VSNSPRAEEPPGQPGMNPLMACVLLKLMIQSDLCWRLPHAGATLDVCQFVDVRSGRAEPGQGRIASGRKLE
jgi:hypothetical protein